MKIGDLVYFGVVLPCCPYDSIAKEEGEVVPIPTVHGCVCRGANSYSIAWGWTAWEDHRAVLHSQSLAREEEE